MTGSRSRGKRDVHTSHLIERLTGAESAIVVNNCASGVLLVLSRGKGGEAIVSRGELIENWRWLSHPGIMAESGAILRKSAPESHETRRYEKNHQRTTAFFELHPSNFT